MQFFIDTANIEDIKKYAEWGVVDGVTTNPSLIAKEDGVSFEDRIKEITGIVEGPISVEVIATDASGMLEEGRIFAAWHKNIYIKVPCTPDGLRAAKQFKKEGIHTNVTLVFSPSQAVLAAKAGATLISPFVGRLDDIGERGMDMIAQTMEVWKHYNFESKILVASVRSLEHVVESAKLGAHIATIPPKIFDELIRHELTNKGIEKFLADWEKVKRA